MGSNAATTDLDYYAILGVERYVSAEDLKKSYHKLAKKYHPDMAPTPDARAQAEEAFKVIAEAYAVLSDPADRRVYDRAHAMAGLSSSDGSTHASSAYARASAAAGRPGRGGFGSAYVKRGGGVGGSDEQEVEEENSGSSSFSAEDLRAKHRYSGRERRADGGLGGGLGEGADEGIDFEEWNRAHFGPTPEQREWATRERIKQARATGFAGFSGGMGGSSGGGSSRGGRWGAVGDSPGWEQRQNARRAAAEWEALHDEKEGAGGAEVGASENAAYRAYAARFRASQAAARRNWPLTVAAWTAVGAFAWFVTRKAHESAATGGGGGGRGGR